MPRPRALVLTPLVFLVLILLAPTLVSAESAAASKPPLYEGLGNYHRPVTTESEEAQAYFDQGMMLAYAFGRSDAAKAFQAAMQADPDCALCSWGEAWAFGPYQNEKMTDENAPKAYAAAQRALALADKANDVERALIEAMAVRFVESPFDEDTASSDRGDLDRAYVEAMRGVAERFPDDLDVQTLFAESLMILHPWDLWPDGEPRPETLEILERLEGVLEVDLRHAGACHMYIHAVEMSHDPDRAEACADLLAEGIPLGSHIQHMPSHIYMRIGRYGDAVVANQQARIVDQMAESGAAVAIYPHHNTHMLWFAAWMDGQSFVALRAARDMSRDRGMMSFLEAVTLVRFGRWAEIGELDKPGKGRLNRGMRRFAEGMAHLRLGDRARAEQALKHLSRVRNKTDPEDTFRPDGEDGPWDLLETVQGILAGEIAAAAGDVDAAVAHLTRAVAAEDALEYNEPEYWPIPPRHVLGAILLDAGRAAEAQAVYEAALEQHRENGWSLHGLAQSLEAQDKKDEAAKVRERFEKAWERADVWLTSSRF